MSPSWLERAEIALGATGIGLARRRLGRPAGATQRTAVEPGTGAPWQAALEKLAAALGELPPGAARVRLSGRFCRFALVPWAQGLAPDEEQALARAVFAETYGHAAGAWEVRVDNARRGEALVACGVDAGLVAELKRVFDEGGWRLESIEPLFAAAISGVAAKSAAWHVLLEPDWWTMALVEGGAWLAVRGVPAQPGGLAALAAALETENLRAGRAVRTVRILPGGAAQDDDAAPSGWTLEPAAPMRQAA